MSKRKKWDRFLVREEAKKYQNKGQFSKHCPGAYRYALKHDMMDEICVHMKNLLNYWNTERVAVEAKKYQRKSDFSKGNCSAYDFARRNNILDEVCKHMNQSNNRKRWTKEEAMILAKKYERWIDFYNEFQGAYRYALRNNILEEICGHLESFKGKKSKDIISKKSDSDID